MYNAMQRGAMRTTLNIDDELLGLAAELTGTTAKTTLVRLGLEALIARESAKRLARSSWSRCRGGARSSWCS
jgi:Arc/MetJ family transcription regulator